LLDRKIVKIVELLLRLEASAVAKKLRWLNLLDRKVVKIVDLPSRPEARAVAKKLPLDQFVIQKSCENS
jgi:hypothetical protein